MNERPMTVSSLADKRCVPCLGGTPPLTPAEIAPLLAQLEGWTVEAHKRLTKPFKFKNFVEAVAFVNAIMPVAEHEGHHPDLHVRWGQVRVDLGPTRSTASPRATSSWRPRSTACMQIAPRRELEEDA